MIGGSFCSFISYEYKTLFNNVTEIYIGLYGIITLPSGQGSAEGLRLFFCCCYYCSLHYFFEMNTWNKLYTNNNIIYIQIKRSIIRNMHIRILLEYISEKKNSR